MKARYIKDLTGNAIFTSAASLALAANMAAGTQPITPEVVHRVLDGRNVHPEQRDAIVRTAGGPHALELTARYLS